jgi:UDP-3-O-[3-hydroxymyristoyl] glucosamine N-acyltransferase
LSVAEVASLTGAEPREGADLSRRLSGIAPVDQAGAGDLTFVADAKFAAALESTKAGAVLTSERFARHVPDGVAVLRTRQPYYDFVMVARKIYGSALRPASVYGNNGVSPSAAVHPSARLARDVTVDPFAVIGPSARIGSGTLINAHAVIGEHVQIGGNCAIGAGCTITHAHLGDDVVIHPGCHIGQDGFGYVSSAEGHIKVPQIGRVVIHNDVEIGSGTRIDRGGMRDTVIGEGTKIDNLCQIGHNCVVGRHCIIVAQSGLSGSVTIEDFVALGPRTGIIPHVTVGKGAMLASRSTRIRRRARRRRLGRLSGQTEAAMDARGGGTCAARGRWSREKQGPPRQIIAAMFRGDARIFSLAAAEKSALFGPWQTNPKPRQKPVRSSSR